MFWLPLIAGVIFACSGPLHQAEGALDDAAELRNYDEILQRILETQSIDKILESQSKLYEEQQKRLNEQAKLYAGKTSDAEFREAELEEPPEEVFLDVNEDREEEKNNKETGEDQPTTTTTDGSMVNEPPESPQALKQTHKEAPGDERDFFVWIIAIGCGVAGLVGLIMAGVCWYKLHSRVKAASDVEYPAYGVTGPTKERLPSPGDRKLAQSAQMYHYQHQKQQMIAMEKANGEMKQDASEDESEEENEEGDYTVYECPGLAPSGEMEVRNPLFTEEGQTPVNGQPPTVNGLGENGSAE